MRTNDDNQIKPIEETCTFHLGIKEEQVTQVSNPLSMEDKNNLQQVIREHANLFAWPATDMPSIDPTFHCCRLSICRDTKPIDQKKRKMGEERC